MSEWLKSFKIVTFGFVTDTCRPMRDGEVDGDGYWYVTRETMEIDIEENKYLEYGEFEGNLYGTKYDSIRRVIKSGRMCIVDANPQVLTIRGEYIKCLY